MPSIFNFWQEGTFDADTRFSIAYTLTTLFCAVGYALVSLVDKDFDKTLVDFWCNDLNGMNDYMRILYYSGLFIIAYTSKFARPHIGDSPLQAYELFRYTVKPWYTLEGCMRFTFMHLFSNEVVLSYINSATYMLWFCCIIGFGGQTAPLTLGLLLLIQHGVVAGCIGTSHRWYVPVYSTLALAFANARHELSADYILAQYMGDAYPFQVYGNESSLLNSGFARKVILFSGLFTLFGGGISKLLNSGIQWCNSECLAYYVSSTENGQSTWLKQLMYKQPMVTIGMAVQSVVFELASILAMFNIGRLPILLMAASLHFGIWLTMWPNYAPQTFCYIFGINHTWFTFDNKHIYVYPTSTAIVASVLMTYLTVLLTMVALLRIEFWPLSGIPMYSLPRDKSFNYAHLKDESQAYYLANEFKLLGYPNTLAWSNQWVKMSLVNGTNTVDLRDYVCNEQNQQGLVPKQWRRSLHNIAARILLDRQTNKEQAKLGTTWLTTKVNELHSILKTKQLPEWSNKSGTKVELYMPLQNGNKFVLADTPWNSKKK